MTQRVALLHTSLVFIQVEPIFKNLFAEIMPDVDVADFIDTRILADVQEQGITDAAIQRMTHLAQAAEASGASVIFSVCSSLGPTIDTARQSVSIPIIKVDDAMADRAVQKGKNVAVLATVPSTLAPTMDLIRHKAEAAGKEIDVIPRLAQGAFERLMGGSREVHDEMVLNEAKDIADQADLIVFAQASMTRLAPTIADAVDIEVLTSPRLGVKSVKHYLDGLRES